MARLDVEKKQPSRWPWFLGFILLIAAGAGITVLLTPDSEPLDRVAAPTVEDTHPPVAVPRPPYEGSLATAAARSVAEVTPLGEEDVGQSVRVEGEVVATGNDAFWLVAGDEVLRVDSSRRVRTGDSLAVDGTLAPADPEKTDRLSEIFSRHPESDGWSVVRAVKLVERGYDAS